MGYTDPNRMSGWNKFLFDKILKKINSLPRDARTVEFHGFTYRIQDIRKFIHEHNK